MVLIRGKQIKSSIMIELRKFFDLYFSTKLLIDCKLQT